MVCELSGLHLENDADAIIVMTDGRKIATLLLEQWIHVQGPTNPLSGLPLTESEVAQILCQGSNIYKLMTTIQDYRDRKESSDAQKPTHSKALAFQRQIFQRQALSTFVEEIIRKDLSMEQVELKLRVIFSGQIRECPTQFLNDLVHMQKTIVDIEENPSETKLDLYQYMVVRSHCRTILHQYLTKSKDDVLALFHEPIHVLNQDLQILVHSTFSQTYLQNIENTIRDLTNVYNMNEISPGSWVINMNAS